MIYVRAGLVVLWWLPTLALMLVHIGWLRLTFRVRLGWAKALRLTGNLAAAMRALDRLEADAAKAARRSLL